MLLSSVRFAFPYSNYRGRALTLNYTVCATSNAKAAFLSSAGLFWQRPTNIPDRTAFRHPVWSTWAMYKRGINETKILQLARDIKERGFQHSHLQIDDGWSNHYGDFQFNPEKLVFSRFNCTNAFILFRNQFDPRPTQPSILPGLVNEYQLRLGRQRQVWFIPLADERGVCR